VQETIVAPDCEDFLLAQMGAERIVSKEILQTLWSGYGQIIRVGLVGGSHQSVVVKAVGLLAADAHPRGWNTSLSHERKLRSYAMETAWYEHWAAECDAQCRVPRCFGVYVREQARCILLEDLDAVGFGVRVNTPSLAQVFSCVNWLANFHARFLGRSPTGLWPTGSYWHLETRPDEFAAMPTGELKQSAKRLDALLSGCQWQTLVHGDAKVANFCFSPDTESVAAVDFQYVGGGCGMKDVVYLISSCFDEADCERYAERVVKQYFDCLAKAVAIWQPQIDFSKLRRSWAGLYSVAWADFYRFLQGWSPGHWKMHAYSERMVAEALQCLK
jgi:hypothetical protein